MATRRAFEITPHFLSIWRNDIKNLRQKKQPWGIETNPSYKFRGNSVEDVHVGNSSLKGLVYAIHQCLHLKYDALPSCHQDG